MLKKFQQLSKNTKKNIVCVAVLAAIGLVLGGYTLYNNWPSPSTNYSMELTEDTALESHVLAVGDIYWGREMRLWAQDWADRTGQSPTQYPFHKLNTFQREAYDAWIGNLECPAIPDVDLSYDYEKEHLRFNCPVEYLPEFSKWLDVVSLANNHTYNGESYSGHDRDSSVGITQEQLDKNGIQYFGNYTPHRLQDICEVVALPARASTDGGQQAVSLPVAMCGYHGAFYTVTEKALGVMREYAKYMPVLAYPHMGQEYQAISDEVREDLYRKMIDNGADVVFGNHPHWVQPTEVYNGKLIVYSMGNFIFDQQFSTEVMRSAAIDMTLSVKKDNADEANLRRWIEIGESCKDFQNGCLGTIKEQNLQRLSFTLSYDIVSADLDNKFTKRASLKSHREILQRLKWEETARQLGQ